MRRERERGGRIDYRGSTERERERERERDRERERERERGHTMSILSPTSLLYTLQVAVTGSEEWKFRNTLLNRTGEIYYT